MTVEDARFCLYPHKCGAYYEKSSGLLRKIRPNKEKQDFNLGNKNGLLYSTFHCLLVLT